MRAMVSTLPTWRTSRYTVVECPEQIDTSNADSVREYLLAELNAGGGAKPIIADLTATVFCDSSAINALLRANTRAQAVGSRLYAVAPPDGIVRKVFEITAITHLIPTYGDVGSAIAKAVVAALEDGGDDVPDSVLGDAPC